RMRASWFKARATLLESRGLTASYAAVRSDLGWLPPIATASAQSRMRALCVRARPSIASEIDRVAEGVFGRAADRFGDGRVCVDRVDQRLRVHLGGLRKRRLGDEVGHSRTDHVRPDQRAGLGVPDHLDEAGLLAGGDGAAERAERELADLDRNALRLRL